MRLSYRSRQVLRRVGQVAVVLLLAAVVLLLCWVLWLRRFVIYTADGVRLDFSMSQQFPQGQTDFTGQDMFVPDIYFSQPAPTVPDQPTLPSLPNPGDDPPAVEQGRFVAYHVSLEELMNERDMVLKRIQALPEGTPVMLDVKGYWGYYYYTSQLGSTSNSFDGATMDAFFAAVHESGAYAIARLPAFRDYDFALNHVACGLKESRGYLWVDEGRCYWLDPANEVAVEHLAQIIRELRDLGFDEVAFTEFRFPDTEEILYTGDRQQAIANAAATLASAFARDNFAVSFITTDPTFPLPEGNCRLYLQDIAAADVQTVLMLMDSAVIRRTVFFTASNDTRFDACGVIRPLKIAE